MSNFKMVLLTAAMIGGMVAGVHYGGKSFFHELAGGDCGTMGCAPPATKSNIWNKAQSTPEQEEWIRKANAPQDRSSSESTKEELGYGDTAATD